MTDASEIVTALAETEPGETSRGWWGCCSFCGETIDEDSALTAHLEACVWRRAVAFTRSRLGPLEYAADPVKVLTVWRHGEHCATECEPARWEIQSARSIVEALDAAGWQITRRA